MAIDGMILNRERESLEAALPFRINRITQISSDDILINVHAQNKRRDLIISTHSLYNRIHFTKMDYTSSGEPGAFVMLLRKHLIGGIIEKIEQVNYDRYLIFYIRALDDLYDVRHWRLHIELMGKYANIILVDENDKIIDALKRIPPFENNKRTIWPGSSFIAPEDQKKKDPFSIEDIDTSKSLVEELSGFSPLLQKEVYYRIDNGEKYHDIIKEIKESDQLYISEVKDNYQYHLIPLKHLNKPYKAYDLDDGFDHLYYALEEKTRIKEITGDLFKFIKRQIKHFTQKKSKLEETLETAKNADDLKMFGDLLYMSGDLERKGNDQIEVFDYDGGKIKIALDPKLSIKENANRYYNNYQKKKRSLRYLDEQIAIVHDELEYFDSLSEQLEIANFNDAQMIKEELIHYGYLKADHKKSQKKKKKETYHLYQIEFKGHHITFGKNHVQNEVLTFKYARPNYTWFHAQNFHGAHLCVDTDAPDEETLRLCANIAAYFSKGRYSSSVPVDYCLARNVKKIKGSKAGLVSIANYKTIFIDPEEPTLEIRSI